MQNDGDLMPAKTPPMTVAVLAAAKGFVEAELCPFGVDDSPDGVAIDYHYADGRIYPRRRLRKSADDGRGFLWSHGSEELIPYGLERPVAYDKGTVVVVEGETDCWACWLGGVPALGLPGVSTTSALRPEHFADVNRVFVVQEPGDAGKGFPAAVAVRLQGFGFTGRVASISLKPFKDARALFNHDRDGFRSAMTAAIKTATTITPARPPGTTSMSLAEAFEMPEVEMDWVVDGLVPRGGILLLSAKPKVGKSVLARTLAVSVAQGIPFLGRHCEQGTVLWIALEERQEHVIKSFRLLGLGKNAAIRLHCGQAPDQAHAWLAREIDAYHPALIVIDTWHKLTLVEDINSYSAVNIANQPLMALARGKNVAQVWLHHNNKGVTRKGDGVLGSSALFAAADTLMTIDRAEDGMRTAWTIQRAGTDMEERVLNMNDNGLVTSGDTRYETQVALTAVKLPELLGDDRLLSAEIVSQTGLRRQIVLAAIRVATDAGSIVSEREGRSIYYRAPSKPERTGSHPIGGTREPRNGAVELREPLNREELGEPGTSGNLGTSGTVDLLAYARTKIGGE